MLNARPMNVDVLESVNLIRALSGRSDIIELIFNHQHMQKYRKCSFECKNKLNIF